MQINAVNNVQSRNYRSRISFKSVSPQELTKTAGLVTSTITGLYGSYLAARKYTITNEFVNIEEYKQSLKQRLEKCDGKIPEGLYNKLKTNIQENNFKISETVEEYYSGLNECETIEDVRKLYPEINPNDIDIEGFERINRNFFDKYGYKTTSISQKMIDSGNPEKVIIDMIKQNYLKFLTLSDVQADVGNGDVIRGYNYFRKYGKAFNILEPKLRSLVKYSESMNEKIVSCKEKDTNEIKSEIMTKTWQESGLKKELYWLTGPMSEQWKKIPAVWHKTMFPEASIYKTDKLIDTYLVVKYTNGNREIKTNNPISTYIEEDGKFNQKQDRLLKRLYKMSRTLDSYRNVLNSSGYKEYKSKFDLEAMARDIEKIEQSYKNIFFKCFWTEERRQRFKETLNENIENYKINTEVADEILKQATDAIFAETKDNATTN
ncbi:hypothetical protein IKQ21_08550 [bacterium]|nr:hypothetical protein [bacterium]